VSSVDVSNLRSSGKLGNIQGMRAFAALAVVLFHLIVTAHRYDIQISILSGAEYWGPAGVDIFFVISGFVMVESQRRKTLNPLAFFKRRVARIAPLYLLLTLAYWGLATVVPSLFPNLVLSTGWLFASMTFTAQAFGFNAPILGQGWTLEFEMLFYLVFASSLFLKNSIKAGISSTLLLLLGVFVLGLNPIMLEFSFGVLIAIFYRSFRLSKVASILAFGVGLVGLILPFGEILKLESRIIYFGIPSFLLILATVNLRQTTNRLLLSLGEASYSVYLIQFFLIPFFFRIVAKSNGIFGSGDFTVLLFAFLILFTGQAVHKLIEKPMTIFLKRIIR
jgi:exopolysaccharide production protein ExoZ